MRFLFIKYLEFKKNCLVIKVIKPIFTIIVDQLKYKITNQNIWTICISNKHRYTIVHFPYGRGLSDPLPDRKKPHTPPPHRNHPNVYCGTKNYSESEATQSYSIWEPLLNPI